MPPAAATHQIVGETDRLNEVPSPIDSGIETLSYHLTPALLAPNLAAGVSGIRCSLIRVYFTGPYYLSPP